MRSSSLRPGSLLPGRRSGPGTGPRKTGPRRARSRHPSGPRWPGQVAPSGPWPHGASAGAKTRGITSAGCRAKSSPARRRAGHGAVRPAPGAARHRLGHREWGCLRAATPSAVFRCKGAKPQWGTLGPGQQRARLVDHSSQDHRCVRPRHARGGFPAAGSAQAHRRPAGRGPGRRR